MFLNYIIFRMCFLFVSSATNVFKEAADLERSFLFLSFVFKPGLNDLLCTHNMTRELDENHAHKRTLQTIFLLINGQKDEDIANNAYQTILYE